MRSILRVGVYLLVSIGLVSWPTFAEDEWTGEVVYGPYSGSPFAVSAESIEAKSASDLFTATAVATPPSRPENASGYTPNGTFTVTIVDHTECDTTFDLRVVGAPFSAVTGTSRVKPAVIVGAFAGDFLFTEANPGTYTVEVVPHIPCHPDFEGIQTLHIIVPDGNAPAISVSVTTVAASLPQSDPGFTPNGSYTITVGNAVGCAGTYTVQYISGPNFPTVTAYIGFGQGNFLFANVGPGIYVARVTQTNIACTNLQTNPVEITFRVPDATAGKLTLLTPNGGEKWRAGSRKDITWNSTGNPGSVVRLDLFRKGQFQFVIENNTPNDGVFRWRIPADLTPGPGYVVRVRSTSDPAIFDYSDGSFRIKPAKKTTSKSPSQ